jgi:hypothetical protein
MDDIMMELRDTRTALSIKIDDSFKDLSTKLQLCEQQLAVCSARIDQSRAHMQANIDTLQADVLKLKTEASTWPSLHTTIGTPLTTLPSSPSINKVVHELNLRTSKKANIILSGLQLSDTTDAVTVEKLLLDELNITTKVSYCTRLGKPNATRPQLLLATLASADDAKRAIRLAKNLRASTCINIRNHVYLNPDLTQEQRTEQYKLRTDLKNRKASGESNLFIENGRIITKTRAAPPTALSASLPAPSATSIATTIVTQTAATPSPTV